MYELRVLRAKKRLTLRELAELSGVSRDTISEIERGLRTPLSGTLRKLAKALQVDPALVVTGGNMRPLPRLQEVREQASLSQGELAKRAGVLKKTIVSIEAGNGSRAQPGTARKIADALGVDVEELYGDPAHFPETSAPYSPGLDQLTATYERDGNWWLASCTEIPGAITQGKTLEEAREMLKDATRLLMETRRDLELRRTEGRPGVIREPLEL